MTREEVHDLMENELRCVQRGNYCDRDCAKCPLVKEDKELIEAYGYVIKALEQEPILDKIFCIVHPLSIMSTPELEHKAMMQIAEMLEPLCLPESEG